MPAEKRRKMRTNFWKQVGKGIFFIQGKRNVVFGERYKVTPKLIQIITEFYISYLENY